MLFSRCATAPKPVVPPVPQGEAAPVVDTNAPSAASCEEMLGRCQESYCSPYGGTTTNFVGCDKEMPEGHWMEQFIRTQPCTSEVIKGTKQTCPSN